MSSWVRSDISSQATYTTISLVNSFCKRILVVLVITFSICFMYPTWARLRIFTLQFGFWLVWFKCSIQILIGVGLRYLNSFSPSWAGSAQPAQVIALLIILFYFLNKKTRPFYSCVTDLEFRLC